METVENFLPPKTLFSTKNVGNQPSGGQVINIETVENVEKSVDCGKQPFVYTSFYAVFSFIVEKLALQLFSALFFRYFRFVLYARDQPRLPLLPFFKLFLEPPLERRASPSVILAASRFILSASPPKILSSFVDFLEAFCKGLFTFRPDEPF